MGYRSCGEILIYGPKREMGGFMATQKLAGLHPCVLEEGEFLTHGDLGIYRLKFDSWKWYESYPDIQAFEELWSRAAEQDGVLSGWRWRVGEDDADIEHASFNDSFGKVEISLAYDGRIDSTPFIGSQPDGAGVMILASTEDGRAEGEALLPMSEVLKLIPEGLRKWCRSHDNEMLLHGSGLNADEFARVVDVFNVLFSRPTEISVGMAYQATNKIPAFMGSTYLDNDSRLYAHTETDHPLMAGNELPQTTEGA